MRVLLTGLYHETNTFLPGTQGLDEFQVRRRSELLDSQGDASPLGGVLEAAQERGWEVIPGLDVRGMPGPTVADEVVELFWSELQATARSAGPLDGICLVLHGAMVSESLPDVEG